MTLLDCTTQKNYHSPNFDLVTKAKATQRTCQEQTKAKKCLNTLVDWKGTFLKLPRWTHNLGGGSLRLIVIFGIKNPRGKTLFKSRILYIIKKISKHKYWKWAHILLWRQWKIKLHGGILLVWKMVVMKCNNHLHGFVWFNVRLLLQFMVF
jgi:hypothetical protein